MGEMSLVGPRPLPADDGDFLGDVRRRLLVRPGMTGLWQVSGRSDLSWDEAVRLDLYYVDNWSLAYDLQHPVAHRSASSSPARAPTELALALACFAARSTATLRCVAGEPVDACVARASRCVAALVARPSSRSCGCAARRGIATADPAGHLRRAAHRRRWPPSRCAPG